MAKRGSGSDRSNIAMRSHPFAPIAAAIRMAPIIAAARHYCSTTRSRIVDRQQRQQQRPRSYCMGDFQSSLCQNPAHSYIRIRSRSTAWNEEPSQGQEAFAGFCCLSWSPASGGNYCTGTICSFATLRSIAQEKACTVLYCLLSVQNPESDSVSAQLRDP